MLDFYGYWHGEKETLIFLKKSGARMNVSRSKKEGQEKKKERL